MQSWRENHPIKEGFVHEYKKLWRPARCSQVGNLYRCAIMKEALIHLTEPSTAPEMARVTATGISKQIQHTGGSTWKIELL